MTKIIENKDPSNWHVIVFDNSNINYYLYYGCTFGYRYSNNKSVKYMFLSCEIHSCIVEVI